MGKVEVVFLLRQQQLGLLDYWLPFGKIKLKKNFISTCSESKVADKPRLSRNKREIPRPKVAEDYFTYAAAIDTKNHVRLGGTNGGWEDLFKTHTPWHKYFSGVLGMCETNAFLAYTYFNKEHKKKRTMSHSAFRQELAMALINNVHLEERQTQSSAEEVMIATNTHALKSYPLARASEKGRKLRRKCVGCKKKVTRYCGDCGDNFPLCVDACHRQHVQQILNSPQDPLFTPSTRRG
eukprot:Awhi_evm2s617